MKIVLEVIRGPHRGRKFTFDGHDNFIVGRAPFARFRLPEKDPYFSRVHFMVEVNPPCCRMLDLGSRNGTRVNGRPVRSASLNHGDLIQGGKTVLKVRFVDPEGKATAVVPAPIQEPATSAEVPPEGLGDTGTYRPDVPSSGAKAADAMEGTADAAPAVEGYQIVRELGRGGMGIVYLATRIRDQSQVALKTIRPSVAGSEREVERFLREADVLGQLRHPNIVAFHEMGQAGELIYFVMDYVPGTDASKLVRSGGPLSVGRAVRLVCDVLEALQYAHGQGFVHRDVKPANLLVSGEEGYETCKLADFGLARVYHASPLSGLTLLGEAAGTLPYMAPEQITDYRNVGPPADQYATAATLYSLLTGRHVLDFRQDQQEQQLAKILLDEPVSIRARRSNIAPALADAIHRALRKEPEARFQDALAFRDALLPFGGGA